MSDILELLAAQEHARWSGWMIWMFDHWTDENIERWKYQMATHYDDLPEHSKESDRKEARKTLALLAHQGIPIEKLLSGEMKAVPAGFLEAAVPINNAERLVVEYAVMKCGHETVELTAAVMNLREMRKQAQLDYAGNPPVTPDLAQTDLQKKG